MLAKGMKLGPYEIVGPLGAGGMGEVYLARDAALGREAAVKVLPAHLGSDGERLLRLEREARVLATLSHPHIATVYGLHDDGGVRFIAMEYVAGEDLSDCIARGPLPWEEAVTVALQIAEALEAAHESGIVHRDLKPANVKLQPDGRVKVLDFGLAKALAPSLDGSGVDPLDSPTITSANTTAGMILGTAAYMSPEQARGRVVDRRSDLWALGVILWEMLTGRRLFAGETVTDTIAAVLRGPLDLDALPAATPTPVRRLVRRCLARDPAQRLRSAGDAVLELRDAAAGQTEPGPTAAPARTARLPWLVAAGALVAVVALAVLLGRRPEPAMPLLRFQINPPQDVHFNTEDAPICLSPDGLRFVCRLEPQEEIVLLSLTGAAPITLAGDGYDPFWSPDGRRVAYFTDQLMVVDVGGKQPQSLTPIADGRGGSWSAQGLVLYSPDPASGLFCVPEGGGEPRQVTTVDRQSGELGHWRPWFLPDGRHFLYMILASQTEVGGLYVGDLDSPMRKRLLPEASAPQYAAGHLLWIQERRLLARPFHAGRLEFTGQAHVLAEDILYSEQYGSASFSASSNGVLAWQRAGIVPDRVLATYSSDGRFLAGIGQPGDFNIDLSPDGRYLAVCSTDSRMHTQDVWIVDFEREVRTRFTLEDSPDFGPVWSPDGQHLAWAFSSSAGWKIRTRRADSSGDTKELLAASDFLEPVDWSPDGTMIIFERYSSAGRGDLHLLPLDGSPPVPFENDRQNTSSARFSPDGRHLAYVSDESGRNEIYVQPFPTTGAKWQISRAGGVAARWSPDGSRLYYVQDRGVLMAVDVRSKVPFDAGPARELFALDSADYEPLPDGSFVASVRGGTPQGTPIDFLMGWPQTLTRP